MSIHSSVSVLLQQGSSLQSFSKVLLGTGFYIHLSPLGQGMSWSVDSGKDAFCSGDLHETAKKPHLMTNITAESPLQMQAFTLLTMNYGADCLRRLEGACLRGLFG